MITFTFCLGFDPFIRSPRFVRQLKRGSSAWIHDHFSEEPSESGGGQKRPPPAGFRASLRDASSGLKDRSRAPESAQPTTTSARAGGRGRPKGLSLPPSRPMALFFGYWWPAAAGGA